MKRIALLLVVCVALMAAGEGLVSAAVSHLSVSLSNNRAGEVSGYTVSFRPGPDGALAPTDTLDLFFDPRVSLPDTIDPANVKVAGVAALSVVVLPAYSRMTVEVPVSLPAGQTASVMIAAPAGIRNPYETGLCELGMRTSREADVVWTSYSVTGTAVTKLSVQADPSIPNAIAEYTIRFRSAAALVAAEDTISIHFPASMSLPSSISKNAIAVNGVTLVEQPVLSNRVLTMVVPATTRVDRDVVVVISTTASIRNPVQAGSYQIGVATSIDTMTATSTLVIASGVSQPIVAVSPATANVSARYTITFATSAAGALSGGQGTITIAFPTGTFVPSTIDRSSITVNGTRLNTGSVSRSGTSITFTLPTTVTVGGSKSVSVVIDSSAGIKNPAPDLYSLSVWTSADTRAVASRIYEIHAGAVTGVKVTVAPPAVGVAGEYRVEFRTSSTGALTGGEDLITIGFPVGTRMPASILRSNVLVNNAPVNTGSVIIDGRTVTFRLPSREDISAGGSVTVVIKEEAGVVNPSTAGADYKLTIATSKDVAPVVSPAYAIYGGRVTGLAAQVSPARAGRVGEYVVVFRTSSEGALTTGDFVEIIFPLGTRVPASIAREHVRVADVAVNTGSISVAGNKVTIPVPRNVTISRSTGTTVRIAAAAGIVSPATPGLYQLDLSTSKDPVPVTSSVYQIQRSDLVQIQIGMHTGYVNDRPIQIDVPPMIIGGRTMVPLRFVADSLGADVDYHHQTKEITITLDNVTILLTVNSTRATVGGRQTTLDSPAVVINGRTLVPIRFVTESLDADVTWHEQTKTVTIER